MMLWVMLCLPDASTDANLTHISCTSMPGTYFLYNYFSNTHPLCQVIIAIKNYKIYFSTFLLKSQLDNVNTTLRLHYYDKRHKDE